MVALLERLLQNAPPPAAIPESASEQASAVAAPVAAPPEPVTAPPPPPAEEAGKRETVLRVCSACYLTEDDLNRTGLLGCPRCYETFAPVIAAAVEVLHGVRVPAEWATPKPRHTVTNPWPTRRGVRIEPR